MSLVTLQELSDLVLEGFAEGKVKPEEKLYLLGADVKIVVANKDGSLTMEEKYDYFNEYPMNQVLYWDQAHLPFNKGETVRQYASRCM